LWPIGGCEEGAAVEIVKLGNGVEVVEYTAEDIATYIDLADAVLAQLGVRISLQDEIEVSEGTFRAPVVE
jgi:hypothetical protein